MSESLEYAGITVFAGRFGSGKTEAAINYALALVREFKDRAPDSGPDARGGSQNAQEQSSNPVVLIDLDIVTPYFRSREMAERIRKHGVDVIAPSVIGQHIHTPAITPQILGAIQQPGRPVILDVGGDRQGARALGQFSAAIRQRGYTMHFVVNPYRPFTDTLEGLTNSISEIEASARLRATSLVSNPNLMNETRPEHIYEGHAKIIEYARALNMPIAFVCLERRWADKVGPTHFAQPTLIMDRHFVPSWE